MLDHISYHEKLDKEEEAILMQRKWFLENGFHQKWVWDENAQNTKI